ncbi:histone-lysine N-methyltransferase PRDM16-like [Bradysia coprophila]|uniref:histone-lysine N-methyltransferase PRDM16-like n=1 Tax=Bradysia coprophila TaxID=38358 RepID=UPI00187D80AC|nr:histone-lysine N-methyltransferase PRDM16-like [Bradysia coprophila]
MSTKCLPKSKLKNVNFKSSYRCRICKNSFKEFIIFEGHFAFNVSCRARNGWFIQCYICGQKQRYLAELKYHLRLHAIQKSSPSTQTDCKIINRAINSENGDSCTNGYQCEICQRNCTTKFYLNEHLLSHSKETTTKKSPNEDTHAKTVDQLPSSTFKIANHEIVHADKAEIDEQTTTHPQGLKCEACNLPFTTEVSLKFHRKLFHQSGTPSTTGSPKENSLQCDICQAKFTFSGNLKRHKLMHTNGDVECKICHIKFTNKALAVHEKAAHPELQDDDALMPEVNQPNDKISTPPITSQIIAPPIVSDSVTSSNESEVSSAPSISASETPPAAPQINYVCGQCGKSVSSSHHLRAHIKSHRQFSCWICSRIFKNRTGLRSHSRSHRFECYICKTNFPSKNRLVTHMGKHQVYEQWIDPATVYLSNWNPEISREILQNQPLVLVKRVDVNNTSLTHPVILDKSNEIDSNMKVKNEPQIIANNTAVPPIMNGESEVDVFEDRTIAEVKYSDQFNILRQIINDKRNAQPVNCVDDQPALSFDDDEIIIIEREPDTTTDCDNVIDISSESDIDEMELYHCYFCNETYRSLESLGVHVKICSYCP